MQSNIQKIVLFPFLLLFSQYCFSQQYFVKIYTIEDGLQTRVINDACQDQNGIMWFATNYGVSKYDGFSFTNYDNTNGLPVQLYRKIKIDERGILWAMPGTQNDTIVYFKDNKWGKISPPEVSTSNRSLNSFDIIYENNQPVICVGGYNGVYIHNINGWTHFALSDHDLKNYVYTVIADKHKFYLATRIGLCEFEKGKLNWSLNQLIKPYGEDIIAISPDDRKKPGEKIWVLNEKWLGYIKQNKFTMVCDNFQLPRPWAKYFLSDSGKIPTPLMITNGFSSDGATSVFIDREQNVWFTDTRGISKFNNLRIINYYKKNGLTDNEVSAVAEMNDGRIVLGHNSGISIIGNNTFQKIPFPESKQKNMRVLDMINDNKGNIWFTSVGLGLGKLLPDGNIIWYHLEKYPAITAVHQDKTGRIWVGADRKLLYLNDNKFVEYELYKEGNNAIRRIFSADKEGIFITGRNGIWNILDDSVKKIPSPIDIKSSDIYCYYKDRKGSVYIGSLNGLYQLENGRIVKYQKNGIDIRGPVFFIFQDHEENYWIGSSDGVYKWNGNDKIEVFNIYNGLSGWETNRAAGMCDSQGRIWVGTDRGLTCFEPGYNQTVIPTPVISLLYIEDSKGVKYPLSDKNSIKYSDNTVSFHFRGISFFNEKLIEYRYKLEGFDQEWQEVRQSLLDNVKYIGLKPGKYTFLVMARNYSGTWSNISKSEVITITAPVYQRWWFLLSAIFVISGILYGFVKIHFQRMQNTRLENEIIERKRIELALIESRQKYHDLVELLPETIYEADPTGKLTFLNDTGLSLFGYEPSELDKDILLDEFVAPESRDDMHMHMESVYGRKKPDRAIMNGKTKNGMAFPFSIHSVPVLFKNRCIGTRGIIINLTEQKHYEDRLQKNAEDLKALNNSKDKLFSIIAHDLRSPFSSFLGFTEILDEEIESLPEDELHMIITSMRKSASNLYQLTENLLEWALLHREITKFEPAAVQLAPLVQSCVDLTIDNARRKNIDIKIDIPTTMEVTADTHMLQTIIRNLMSNAIKFTHKGGNIQMSARVNEEHLITLAVKDNGIGIPAEMLNSIFLIDSSNKTKGTDGELSTGLGLILCKEFVEKHGGKIWVESEEGKGSTFYFTIKGVDI